MYFSICIQDFFQYIGDNIQSFYFVLTFSDLSFHGRNTGTIDVVGNAYIPRVVLACPEYIVVNYIGKINITGKL